MLLLLTQYSQIFVNGSVTSSGGNSTFGVNAGGAAGAITFNTNNQNIQLNDATITSAGGAGNGGANQGAGGKVTFSDEVLLSTIGSTINTGASGGDILFIDSLNGSQSLTLTAGGGDITFTKAVGASTDSEH